MSGARESAISGEDLDADNAGGDESTKSERKRQRERQRRSDLASAFDELAAILSLIDPDESDSMSTRQKRKKKSVGDSADPDAGDNAGSTRLDLIGKSVEVLRRLHSENIELKRIHENSGEGKDDKVRKIHAMAARFLIIITHMRYNILGGVCDGSDSDIGRQ